MWMCCLFVAIFSLCGLRGTRGGGSLWGIAVRVCAGSRVSRRRFRGCGVRGGMGRERVKGRILWSVGFSWHFR